jgi:hypothetical protein
MRYLVLNRETKKKCKKYSWRFWLFLESARHLSRNWKSVRQLVEQFHDCQVKSRGETEDPGSHLLIKIRGGKADEAYQAIKRIEEEAYQYENRAGKQTKKLNDTVVETLCPT